MAVARCNQCGPPQGLKHDYSHRHTLDGGNPVICAALNCSSLVSSIWLTDEEEQQYLLGNRSFTIPFHRAVVLVT